MNTGPGTQGLTIQGQLEIIDPSTGKLMDIAQSIVDLIQLKNSFSQVPSCACQQDVVLQLQQDLADLKEQLMAHLAKPKVVEATFTPALVVVEKEPTETEAEVVIKKQPTKKK